MGERANEYLRQLAQAQEGVFDVSGVLEKWEASRRKLEKTSFDSINISDKAMNLSREGKKLAAELLSKYSQLTERLDMDDVKNLEGLLEETVMVFQRLREVALLSSDTAHSLEQEAAMQREITESVTDSIDLIGKSINQAVACLELCEIKEVNLKIENHKHVSTP